MVVCSASTDSALFGQRHTRSDEVHVGSSNLRHDNQFSHHRGRSCLVDAKIGFYKMIELDMSQFRDGLVLTKLSRGYKHCRFALFILVLLILNFTNCSNTNKVVSPKAKTLATNAQLQK